MGTSSTDVNPGSTEQAEACAEASIGSEAAEKRSRLHFLYLEQGMRNIPHIKGRTNLPHIFGRHRLSFLRYHCVGTWAHSCLGVLFQESP